MRLPRFEYLEAKTVTEACSLLDQYRTEGVRLLAGGTDLLPALKQRIIKPAYLIDLKKIPSLAGIDYDPNRGLQIGALTTLRSLQGHAAVLQHYTALAEAAHAVGAMQHQNMGTIGGNICQDTRCWYYNQSDFWRKSRETCRKLGGQTCHVVRGGDRCFAVYQGDTAPVLIALGAQITLEDKEGKTKSLPLKDFFSGEGKTPHRLGEAEVLTGITLPIPPPCSGSSYQKLRLRESIDFPLVSAAVALSLERGNGKIKEVQAVLSAVGSGPVVLEELPPLLVGNTLNEELMEKATQIATKNAHPVANTLSTPDYRKRMAGVMLKRALRAALEEAKKKGD